MSSQIIRSQVGFPRPQRAVAGVDHTLLEHTLVDHSSLDHTRLDHTRLDHTRLDPRLVDSRLVDLGLVVALLGTVIFFAVQLL
jgi:hypothetical protein